MNDTARQDRKANRERSKADRIFRIYLNIAKPKGFRAITTPVARILFDAPPNAELHERRTHDHHMVVPCGFVLTKWRPVNTSVSRDDVLQAVRMRIEASSFPGFLPYTADALVELLADLFEIADRWHWDDLLDRLPDETPQQLAKKSHSEGNMKNAER